MAWIVRYKCHQCGAVREPGTEAGWVRCNHCRALVAYDWQSWFASAEYRAYLTRSASGDATQRWQEHQALLARADQCAGEEATKLYEQATELGFDLLPGIAPPEVQTDPEYRRKLRVYAGAFHRLQRNVPGLRALTDELTGLLKGLNYQDPLPTILKALELVSAQFLRTVAMGVPEDPDGLPATARLKAIQSQFAGGYVQLLSSDAQATLLKHIYGADAVQPSGGSDEDDGVSLFRDWCCPACGLWSPQSRYVQEFTCLGCFFRKPLSAEDDALPLVETKCASCAADLRLEKNQAERACEYCNTWVRRVRTDRKNYTDFSNDVRASTRARVLQDTGYDIQIEPLPLEGKAGLPVTRETRELLKLQGFVRVLSSYQAMLPIKKLLSLLQRTFHPERSRGIAESLAAVRTQAETDGSLTSISATLDAMLKEATK